MSSSPTVTGTPISEMDPYGQLMALSCSAGYVKACNFLVTIMAFSILFWMLLACVILSPLFFYFCGGLVRLRNFAKKENEKIDAAAAGADIDLELGETLHRPSVRDFAAAHAHTSAPAS
ncbi:hypothetical protein QBC47DRAFT_401796 [Echria macrotheca]|uniref:Uncharacterized protein n=1 Tax=Echria macrotheca TaxID=438768 RepID=A0AAJ0BE59_9PEZI|nr:hypothetical protein QBC47DRAFT_401796 [Echria macrotheca]